LAKVTVMKVASGSVVEIDLGADGIAYGRLLLPPMFEFFDLRGGGLDAIPSAEVLFRIDVMTTAIKSGRWPVIGVIPLSASERGHLEVFFKQNPLTGALSFYSENRLSKQVLTSPATFEECERLERAAVWDPTHVEDRLRDHFAGRPNKWVESLRPRR
jgi:hypothetical protein